MVQEKRPAHPEHPGDLVCGTCPARSPWMDTVEATRDRARVAHWRLHQGPSLTGKPLDLVLCPTCFKVGAERRPTGTPVLENQMDLPGLITPVPVEKSKKNKRHIS